MVSKNRRTSGGSGDTAARAGRAIRYGTMVWQAAHLRVFCQCRALVSSDWAALSSENARASGSSATSGVGVGTLSSVWGSPALAEAPRIRTTANREQEEGLI